MSKLWPMTCHPVNCEAPGSAARNHKFCPPVRRCPHEVADYQYCDDCETCEHSDLEDFHCTNCGADRTEEIMSAAHENAEMMMGER